MHVQETSGQPADLEGVMLRPVDLPFEPTHPSDWEDDPKNLQQAIDELAARGLLEVEDKAKPSPWIRILDLSVVTFPPGEVQTLVVPDCPGAYVVAWSLNHPLPPELRVRAALATGPGGNVAIEMVNASTKPLQAPAGLLLTVASVA